ncbi:MAG: hypothetical protein CM1200mP2_24110 [Planctomycetaceae bacterium]|nr:MAG: hypothetical protein CM1200mP2_24110 [Planctomycetaceae bacterium]
MEVTGPAPIGGNQPLQPIQPPETVTPSSDVAPADAVDRVEFSPEAQAQVEAGAPVTGTEAVGEVASTGSTLPALRLIRRTQAGWPSRRRPKPRRFLRGPRRFWVSQGYGEADVTSHLEAYQATLDQLRTTG